MCSRTSRNISRVPRIYNRQDMETPLQEFSVLQEYASGAISADASFEQIYGLYGTVVRNWTRIAAAESADDLFQDTWLIFYNRWRTWSFQEQPGQPTGRPVLSFLYRTMQLVLRGYRRKKERAHESLDRIEATNGSSHSQKLQASIELGRVLERAQTACPPEELDVLLGKLSGLPAAEIASALGTTPAAVDHRFRSAIARLQAELGYSKPRRIHHAK